MKPVVKPEKLAYPPSLIRVRAVYYTGFPGANNDLVTMRRTGINVLNKMKEFHSGARAANLATGRRARAAAGPRQTQPAQPVWEPSSLWIAPPAAPGACHR